MSYFRLQDNFVSANALGRLQQKVLRCPYLGVNNLNRDFMGTRGFSIVFQRAGIPQVLAAFPFLQTTIDRVLLPDCNAFYLNPLVMTTGSQVDPHVDRSLRSYCKTINPPDWVSVLYVAVPDPLVGGQLVLSLSQNRRRVGEIRPQRGRLLYFQGNLLHAVERVESAGIRLSVVCEQYCLLESEVEQIPTFTVESRAARY